MIAYIAGPMTGHPRWNFDAFAAAAADLRAHGLTVISPHEMDLADGFDPDAPVGDYTEADRHRAMRKDIAAVLSADVVYCLPGWTLSRGAQLEIKVAQAVGTPCHIYECARPATSTTPSSLPSTKDTNQ